MNIATVSEKLRELRLGQMARSLEEKAQRGEIDKMDAVELLQVLLDDETLYRKRSKYDRAVKKASFKQKAHLEDVECNASRGLSKTMLARFANAQWIEEHNNVFISGSTGTGKTFLSCAIGRMACRMGYSAQYWRTSTLLQRLILLKGRDEYISFRESIAKVRLLVLDDFAIPAFDSSESVEMLELMDDRYLSCSTILITQLPKAKVHAAFAEPTVADACCDRVLTSSIDVPLDGPTLRKKAKKG